jgi:protein-disulfide isomerase
VTRFLLRAVNLIGLALSSILLVDYLQPLPVFCTGAGGCGLVRESRWSSFFGVPTPAYGILFYVVALALSLIPARRLLVAWATAGAVAAVGFIALQLFVIKALCPFCIAVDGAAIVLFLLVLADRDDVAAVSGQTRGTVLALAVVAAILPFGLQKVVAKASPSPSPRATIIAPAYPDSVAVEQKPGWITIVEFVDFECPYCRRLHQEIKKAVEEFGGAVRVVRKHNPLSMHENAVPAARAACCGAEQGKGEEMAEALFSAPPDEIDAAGCEKIAEKLGLDMEKYRACIASKRPDERIAADQAEAAAAGIADIAPVFWVGHQKFEGVVPAPVIRQALAQAR